jgi:hypothetical protein
MNITSATYYKAPLDNPDNINTSITVIANGETWSVPLDPANRHYQAIQEWVAEGNTIEEAD